MKQKYKIYNLMLLLISTSVIGVILFLVKTYNCYQNGVVDYTCYDFQEQKMQPLFISFLPLLLISVILFFVRREAFIAWAKFAGVAFPLMLGTLLYTFTHESESAAWMSGPSNAQMAMTILPFLFIITSFVIIAFNQAKR